MKNCLVTSLKNDLGNSADQVFIGDDISIEFLPLSVSEKIQGIVFFKNNIDTISEPLSENLYYAKGRYPYNLPSTSFTALSETLKISEPYYYVSIGHLRDGNRGFVKVNGKSIRAIIHISNYTAPWYINPEILSTKLINLTEVDLFDFRNYETEKTLILEEFFEWKIESIKKRESTQNPSFLFTVFNSLTLLSTQQLITFNGVPFYDNLLAMEGNYDSNVFTFYGDREGSLGGGYTYSNPVATFNYTTKEWSYL